MVKDTPVQQIKTKEFKSGTTTICVAFYEDRYELTIMTEIGKEAYNHLVLYFLPSEFKKLSQQWLDLVGESA